jgi:hypothetical protein
MRMQITQRLWPAFILILCLGILVSCVTQKLDRSLSGRELELTRQIQGVYASGADQKAARYLSWGEACALLEERNLSLKQGNIRLRQAKEDRDEQWKTWLPKMWVYANLQTAISGISRLALSDIDASVILPLRLPNPISEQAQAVRLALSYLEAKDQHELMRRRQHIALYRLFSRYADYVEQREYNARRSATEDLGTVISAYDQKLNDVDTEKSIAFDLSQLLDLPGEYVLPNAKTRPLFNYHHRYASLKPGINYGKMAIRMSAYQIEAAVLRVTAAKWNILPSVTVGANNPSLYDTRNNANADPLDPDRIQLFGGLVKGFDLTQKESQSIKSAEDNLMYVQKNLRLRMDADYKQWRRLCERYAGMNRKEAMINQRIAIMREKKDDLGAWLELEAVRQREMEFRQVKRVKENLDLEIWLWDDSAW